MRKSPKANRAAAEVWGEAPILVEVDLIQIDNSW
jgi:hypothetical protein